MAATVTFDGVRVDPADTTTNWTNWGATATEETDYFYQNSVCISCQVKTAEVGQYLTDPSTVDYATTPKVVLFKVIQTNWGAIDGNGLQLYIGNDDSNHNRYEIFSATTYPPLGGFQIVPIDPNLSGYVTQVVGTVALGTVDFYGIQSDASATAKAPNLGIDAVDYVDSGTGLSLDGTLGSFADYVSFDEGVVTNRYGIATTKDDILYIIAVLTIGSATLTTFSDSNQTLVFPDGRFNTGFSGIDIDLQNASTVIVLTANSFVGKGSDGADGASADTRPSIGVSSTSGSLEITGGSFLNFNAFVLTSGVTLDTVAFVEPNSMIQASAVITDCSLDSPTVATTVPFLTSDDIGSISGCTFVSSGTGHAIKLTSDHAASPSEHSFTDITSSGYSGTPGSNLVAASGDNDATIFNDSGKHLILNLSGGTNPSVRNGTGATTTIQAAFVLTLTNLVVGMDLTIVNSSTRTELKHEVLTGTSTTYTHTGGETVDILLNSLAYDPNLSDVYDLTLPSEDSSIKFQLIDDPNYENP